STAVLAGAVPTQPTSTADAGPVADQRRPGDEQGAAALDSATGAARAGSRSVAPSAGGGHRAGGAVWPGGRRVVGDRRVPDRQRPGVTDPAPVAGVARAAGRLVGG